MQIKIWFQNRRNKWKRQIATDVDGIGIGITPPVLQGNPFMEPMSQSVILSTSDHQRGPQQFQSQRPFSVNAGGTAFNCLPNQYAGMSRFPLSLQRMSYPWPSGMPSALSRVQQSALACYPRAMMAAMAVAAASNGCSGVNMDKLSVPGTLSPDGAFRPINESASDAFDTVNSVPRANKSPSATSTNDETVLDRPTPMQQDQTSKTNDPKSLEAN